MNDQAHFDRLVGDLAAAAAAYYESDVLLMSDADYDAGIARIEMALAVNPSWANDDTDALLRQVAAGQSAGGDVVHPQRMLSLDKVTLPALTDTAGRDTVLTTVARMFEGVRVAVEPKMDGLALRVEYDQGRLALAATRGDGFAGEDVTDRVLRGTGIVGLPAVLPSRWTGEVRGEVIMSAGQFDEAQKLRAARGGKPFVNPRNATAGALRKSGDEHWMPMTFVVYDVLAGDAPESHLARMDWCVAEAGLLPAAALVPGPSDELFTQILAIEEKRDAIGFDIDGVVVKADRDSDREALGEASRTPKWALAVKFPADEATAVVEDVEVTVGRTGRIGLRARITPTFVGGTTVTYATLHNPSWVVDQGIGIGSTVMLKRAGDVIPRITAPLDVAANDGVIPWTPPSECPQCGEAWNTESLLWRCETPSCGLVNALDYFAGRDAMDVEGLGGAVAEALVADDRVADVADLFDLGATGFADLVLGETPSGGVRRLGEANAAKIAANLETAKSQPLARVITALGIRGTGRSLSRALAREFPTMNRLRSASVTELAAVEKIGPKKAALIADQIRALGPVIDRLATAGVNMGLEPDPASTSAASDLPLAGKTVVISGAIPGYTRTTAQEAVEAAGGKSSGSVSAKTDYLVTAETTTSKAQKAETLGVPVVDPVDFARLLAGEIG